MKHWRMIALCVVVALLGLMAILNIQIHLHIARAGEEPAVATTAASAPVAGGYDYVGTEQLYAQRPSMPTPAAPAPSLGAAQARPAWQAQPAQGQGQAQPGQQLQSGAQPGTAAAAAAASSLWSTPAASPAPAPTQPVQPVQPVVPQQQQQQQQQQPAAVAQPPARPVASVTSLRGFSSQPQTRKIAPTAIGAKPAPLPAGAPAPGTATAARPVASGVALPASIAEQQALPKALTVQQRDAMHAHCTAKPAKFHYMTYANFRGSDDKFCRFLESAAQNRIPLEVLNWGGEHKGNGNKLVQTRLALMAMDPCDVVIFTDAFDVLWGEPPKEVEKKFLEMNPPFLVSAECGCWPFIMQGRDICLKKFPESPTDYRYINTGAWAARAYAAEEVIRRVTDNQPSVDMVEKNCDQEQTSNLLLTGEMRWNKDIVLDYYAKLFLNMHMADDFGRCYPQKDVRLVDGRLYNSHTKTVPSLYHFNGGTKNLMGHAQDAMWYKQPSPIAPVLTHEEVMNTQFTSANKTIVVKDMCPGYSGKSLLRPGTRNVFYR